MVDAKIEAQELLLRNRVSDFLKKQTEHRKPMQSVLQNFNANQWSAYIFGGVARDLLCYGLKAKVRDVDIVVDTESEGMRETLKTYVKRQTRFGGLHMEHRGWLFDVWSLPSTWAFREQFVKSSDFAELPKTTFLNVEAIAVELTESRKQRRNIYTYGFFEAFLNRTIEINLEENPYPELCVVRSLITAARLNFEIGPRLASYIVYHSHKVDVEAFLHVQQSHYGRVYLDQTRLALWLHAIEEQQHTSMSSNARLPGAYSRQLDFYEKLTRT